MRDGTDSAATTEPVRGRRRARRRPHVVIAVVNLPAERDRRVIRECRALESGGYRVTVICPRGKAPLKRLPGTRDTAIRTFPQPFAGSGVVSFAVEFAWSFTCVAWHLLVLVATQRVAAAQVCNPPDAFWALGLLMRALGKPWVFDHHDLCPELYECKTGDTGEHNRAVLGTLKWFERMSMRCATAVFSTNESYREIALGRGGCRPERVTVVRNGPALAEVTQPQGPVLPDQPTAAPAWTTWERQRIAYIGVINPQDRVDIAVLAAESLVELRGRDTWELVIAGDGECLPALRTLVAERGLGDVVTFAGWLEAPQVDQLLRTATLAIQPDPPTKMADLSTMAKTVEYLARGVPIVATDLRETRFSAGAAAVYVPTGAPEEFAKAIDHLLDSETELAAMREAGLDRFRRVLAWDHQAEAYLRVWNRLVPVAA